MKTWLKTIFLFYDKDLFVICDSWLGAPLVIIQLSN